jgi:hypothetical protein
MKKMLSLLLVTAVCSVFAALPDSIWMQSGEIKIRLDSRKRWNINRIEWKSALVCLDAPGAHYGMTYRPHGSPHFIGSGHTESGIGEKVVDIHFFVDGKEVTPGKQLLSGKVIAMKKESVVHDLKVKYSFEIKNNIISEVTEVSAEKDVKIRQLYCFMHPWTIRFTDYLAVFENGKKLTAKFISDEKHRNRKFVPCASWYDSKSGIGVSTVIEKPAFSRNLERLVWDRKCYRKDYLFVVKDSTFPGGKTAVYRAKTGFFRQKDPAKWISDAQNSYKKLK